MAYLFLAEIAKKAFLPRGGGGASVNGAIRAPKNGRPRLAEL
jgi:hypothetical protein